MSDQEIKRLKQKRGFPRGSLTRLEAVDYSTVPLDEIFVSLELLDKAYIEFKEYDEKLSEYDLSHSLIEEFEPRYIKLKALLRRYSNSHNPSLNTVEKQLNETMNAFSIQQKEILDSIRDQSFSAPKDEFTSLPKIDMPYFYGKRSEEFQSFKDLFTNIVHKNLSLSNCQKLAYLKRLLKGDAYTFIRHIMVTDANYESTWQKVCSRFEKPAQVISSFAKRFLEQPTVPQNSTQALRKLCDTSNEIVSGLKALGSEAEKRDVWLIHIILNKLDCDTRTAWANKTVDTHYPTFESLLEFLERRCTALENCDIPQKRQSSFKPSQSIKSYNTVTSQPEQFNKSKNNSNSSKPSPKCPKCSDSHRLSDCAEYNALDLTQRRELVASIHCCFNCLGIGHSSKNCASRRRCFVCSRKHHTTLHAQQDSQNEKSLSDQNKNTHNDSTGESSSIATHLSIFSSPILPTARVNILNRKGNPVLCRILFDSGSNGSLISESCMQKLKLPRSNARFPVRGIASKATTRGLTNITISPHFNCDFQLNMKVFIMDHLTSNLPKIQSNILQEWDALKSITLADPLDNTHLEIDMVMGVGYFFKILKEGQFEGPNELVCQNTKFGWIIGGGNTFVSGQKSFNIEVNFNIDLSLRKFWELEEITPFENLSSTEQLCENIFTKSSSRTSDGRFIVRLPFIENPPPLGKSLPQAISRFMSIERKLQSNSDLKNEYVTFMREYIDLNHMEELSENDSKLSPDKYFYLPHHPVVKESSLTTKVRVVFDGSAKTSTCISLNDILLIGPTVQSELISIILRFRLHDVVFTADVEKMYRQIRIHPSDTNFQRIVWREDPYSTLKHYKLTTVTYGTSSAPYLATRCLQQLAFDNQKTYPQASAAIEQDFYVDDILSGASTETDAIMVAKQINNILKGAGLNLLKWASNSERFMHEISSTSNLSHAVIDITKENSHKILGLHWIPKNDSFQFKVNMIHDDETLTKRKFLSDASRLFDPLGWLSPVIISIKILFQQLWLHNLSWDDLLPTEINNKWKSIKSELNLIENISIPRYLQFNGNTIELHGFSDSSQLAYGAALYMRSTNEAGDVQINLIAAKTRVAPIKKLTIPRLELSAAHLLAKLTKKVMDQLRLNSVQSYSWSDSQIVLHWLSKQPSKWPTFVANRTAQIHEMLPTTIWNHVDTKSNPADCCSRGLMSHEFINHSLWWHGPNWLKLPKTQWPSRKNSTISDDEAQQNAKTIIQHNIADLDKNLDVENHVINKLFQKHSSYSKIIRILSYCAKFINHIKLKSTTGITKVIKPIQEVSPTTKAEIMQATKYCCNWAQHEVFADEIRLLSNKKQLKKSSIISLSPFLDEDNLLRVGGRLKNAPVSFNSKHPIILPKNHILSKSILTYLHLKYFHPPASTLFHLSRQSFWIVNGKVLAKYITNACLICFKLKAQPVPQKMGNLPTVRTTKARPFSKVGVDFAGPIQIASKRGRGAKITKAYVAVFVCMVVKAVHLELVSDLSTEAFLAAVRRFASRRGKPSDIYSDNGTNFRGAWNKLTEIERHIKKSEETFKISNELANLGIQWHFTPPSSPSMGGLWESSVKSMKHHLIRATKNTNLTFEEHCTLLCQIEAILNSRPLTAITTDPQDELPLTPAHFLLIEPLNAIPDEDVTHLPSNRLNIWQNIQKRVQGFWSRFSKEYLHTMQQRQKWTKESENMKIGDIVYITSENTLPLQWPMGRIIDTHSGNDNIIRVVSIKTQNSILKRPILKLIKIPMVEDTPQGPPIC